MPFKSEKQRRWMYANKPAMARKWQSEYYNSGGKVTPDIEAEQLLEEFNANRQAVLFLQEGGKVNDLTDEQVYAAAEEAGIELVWRNGREKSVSELKYALRTKLSNEALTKTLDVVLGKSDSEKVRRNRFHAEYTRLRNEGELQDVKFPEWFEQVKDDPDYAHITGESVTDVKTIIGTLIDFTPILGDVKALFEAAAAWIKGNKLEAGLLAGAAAIGLVPGAGDAFAALMKRAAKIVGRTFSKIARGVENAVGTDGAAALGGEMSEAAGKAAIEIVGGADEASVIEKHIAELIAIARSRGFEVKRSDDYQYEHFGARGGKDGQPVSYSKAASDRIKPYINIPEGSTQGEYVIALEEFAHALETGTRQIPGEIGVLTSEARAKLSAIKNSRVPLNPEVMQQVADTYSNYLGLIVRAYDARRMDVFNELVDGLPPANDKIWDLLNSDKFEYVSAAGLRGRNQEKHIKDLREHVAAAEGRLADQGKLVDKPSLRDADPEDRDVAADAGRPPVIRQMEMITPDGEVIDLPDSENLVETLADLTGKAPKTIRNKLSRGEEIIADDGTVFREKGVVGKAEDAREGTLGQIEGYDGTFSDLMREHGIDPRSVEANTIRQRMARGHEWKGYRRSDVEDFETRTQRMTEERLERDSDRGARILIRERRIVEEQMRRLGVDPADEEATEAYNKLRRSISKYLQTYHRQFANQWNPPRDLVQQVWLKSPASAEARRFMKMYSSLRMPRGSAREQKVWFQDKFRNLLSSDDYTTIRNQPISEEELAEGVEAWKKEKRFDAILKSRIREDMAKRYPTTKGLSDEAAELEAARVDKLTFVQEKGKKRLAAIGIDNPTDELVKEFSPMWEKARPQRQAYSNYQGAGRTTEIPIEKVRTTADIRWRAGGLREELGLSTVEAQKIVYQAWLEHKIGPEGITVWAEFLRNNAPETFESLPGGTVSQKVSDLLYSLNLGEGYVF